MASAAENLNNIKTWNHWIAGRPEPSDSGRDWVGNRCQPTILTGVVDEMIVCREETFGPVTSIYPVDSAAEALEKANDTEFGLSAAVFTQDIDKALTLAG